jgi:hypothetical protein
VFKRVRAAVAEETRNNQIPWDSSSLVGDFRFGLSPVKNPDPVQSERAGRPAKSFVAPTF